jgi:hypothetical protein
VTARKVYLDRPMLIRSSSKEHQVITADTVTDRQIRELQAALFAGPADEQQLSGLVACHDALGRSHRRSLSRAHCVELINGRQPNKQESAEHPMDVWRP